MSLSKWFLEEAGRILNGANVGVGPALEKLIEETEGLENADMGFVQITSALAPEPITADSYAAHNPYNKPERFLTMMQESADRGWIKEVGASAFTVTEEGEKVVDQILDILVDKYTNLDVLPEEEMARLLGLIQKVVNGIEEFSSFADKPTFALAKAFQNRFVPEGAPLLVVLRRKLIDLFYFRDDAHIAAWKQYEASGPLWEALTYLWRQEEGGTPAELAERYGSFRGFNETEYRGMFNELIDKGFVAEKDEKFEVTDAGKELREKAEKETDNLFESAWKSISKEELSELKELINKLAELLQPPTEEEA